MNTFSAGQCISYGWETFKKRPWFFIGSYLLYTVVVGVLSSALLQIAKEGAVVGLVANILRLVVEIIAGMGMINFALRSHDDVEHVSIMDFWHPAPFWSYTGATLLFWLIMLVGLILLIVPGIIWSLMFGFAGYLIIDRNLGPIEALKESKRITYGYKWELFLLGLAIFGIVILGLICLIIGILVAYPIVLIAMAHAYRTLESKADAVATSPAPAPATAI